MVYPNASRISSSLCSGLQITNFFIAIWLLYTKHWIIAAIYLLNLFFIGKLSRILNPIFFLERDIKYETNLEKKFKKQALLALIETTRKSFYGVKGEHEEYASPATD
jgi:hypothetical protein